MPCNCDYLQASGVELESIRVCKLLVYLYECSGIDIPAWIVKATNNYYGNVDRLDEATKMLCYALRAMNPKDMEKYVYDAHSKTARRLANWWERHQEWDERRVKEEETAAKKTKTKKKALSKLSKEELEALGLL
jgi:hypothetical protein